MKIECNYNSEEIIFHGMTPTTDLALYYHKGFDREKARRHFTQLLRETNGLLEALAVTGFTTRQQFITPLQRDIIFRFLGKP